MIDYLLSFVYSIDIHCTFIATCACISATYQKVYVVTVYDSQSALLLNRGELGRGKHVHPAFQLTECIHFCKHQPNNGSCMVGTVASPHATTARRISSK